MSLVITLTNNPAYIQATSSTLQCSNASKLASSAAYAAPHHNIQICEIINPSAIYFINVCGNTSKKQYPTCTGSIEYLPM